MNKIISVKNILFVTIALLLCILFANKFDNKQITSFCKPVYGNKYVNTNLSEIGFINRDLTDGLLLIWENGKQGYIDINGKVIIKPFLNKNHIIGINSKYLIANKNSNKWSIIDSNGKLIFDNKFDNAYPVSNTLMAIKKNDKYAIIKYTGEEISQFEYDNLIRGGENLVAVKKDNKWSFLSSNGKLIAPFIFDDIRPFKEGRAAVKQGEYWNFISTSGKVINNSKYVIAGDFSEGVAAVLDKDTSSSDNHLYFIDIQGKLLLKSPSNIKIRDSFLGEFEGGRFDLETYSDLDMIIDVFFHNGGTSSGLRNKTINLKGDVLQNDLNIISCSECICSFQDTRKILHNQDNLPFVLAGNSPKGFMNADQKVIVEPQFEEVGNFTEGLAVVRQNGKYGFIDRTGKFVIQPQFDAVSSFYNSVAIVHSKKVSSKDYSFRGYINKKGNFIWQVEGGN